MARATPGTSFRTARPPIPLATAAGSSCRTARRRPGSAAARARSGSTATAGSATPTGSSAARTSTAPAGATPWGTWLSCEEVDRGRVWECDPKGRRRAVARPAMGVFKHEAAAVDPRGKRVYLTEDLGDGGFYRFTPKRWPSLAKGRLEIASVAPSGAVRWHEVPDPAATTTPTRQQVPGEHAVCARRGHLVRQRHRVRGHHERQPGARVRHAPAADRGDLRRGQAQGPAAHRRRQHHRRPLG